MVTHVMMLCSCPVIFFEPIVASKTQGKDLSEALQNLSKLVEAASVRCLFCVTISRSDGDTFYDTMFMSGSLVCGHCSITEARQNS